MERSVANYLRSRGEVMMPVRLVKCGWCPRDCYPNELRYSKKLDCMVCPDCDCDNDITLGEIEERKRKKARDTAWQDVCGMVK